MSVPGVCPECGAKFALHLALQDARARQALFAALRIAPSLADRIVAYLNLFSPAKRAMRMDKLARLLDEIATALQASEIQRKGRVWAAPVEYWRDALDQILAKQGLDLPLESHALLFEIISRIANKAEGQRERQHEEHVRHGPTTTPARPKSMSAQEMFDRHMQELGVAPKEPEHD